MTYKIKKSTLTVLTILCRCLPKFTGTILVVVVGKHFFTYLSADLFYMC